ncbi:8776_t:CDS:2 [Rhizophagus irregularis]|nr:8776_t:CDS:2 [Rhizophagus irregularis]
MEKQMQDSIRYSTVLTIIEISDHVEIGKLIGRNGRNLKPIEKGTGTHIYINTKKSPQQIEIKINNKDNEDRDENISTGERINKAICQIDKGKDGSFRDEESLSKAIADSIKKEGPDGVWIIPSRKKILEELTEDAVFDTLNNKVKAGQPILEATSSSNNLITTNKKTIKGNKKPTRKNFENIQRLMKIVQRES